MKKIFMFFLMGMFLISLATASIYYEEENKTYVIDTWVPNWLGGNGESVVTLVDNTDQCLIDCSFHLSGTNEKPVNLIDEINFINRAGIDVSSNLNSIDFELGTYQEVEKFNEVYEESCEDVFNETLGNSTQVCQNQLISNESYFENELVWQDYVGQEVDGYWELKAKAQKKKVSMDWIVTFRGEELSNWAWWNSNWEKKKELTLTENSGGTLTNYQVPINISYESSMQSDFDDLRFLDSTESTELDFYLKEKSDGNWAYVLVEVPSMTASSNTTIYMYYGNVGASSTSDAQATYVLYDNFNDNSKNATLWNDGDNPCSETNQRIECSATFNSYATLKSDVQFGVNYALEFDTWTSSLGSSSYYRMGFGNNPTFVTRDTYYRSDLWYYTGPNYKYVNVNSGGATTSDITSASYSSQTTYEIRRFSNETQYWKSGALDKTITSNIDTGNENVHFSGNANSGTLYGDNVFVRKIVYQEPTTTFGPEENSNSFAINSISPIDYYNSSSQDVTFECNTSDETGIYTLNLTINGSVYHTETGAGNTNLTLSSTETLSDGFWEWYCTANDDAESKNSTTRYLTIDSTEPSLNLYEPTTNATTSSLPINITLNVSVSDTHLDSCWYWTNENATNITYTCNTLTNATFSNEGVYTINYCANDTFSNENCDSVSNTIFYYTYSQLASDSAVGEGDSVTFTLYVNMTNTPETNAVLNLNNTEYSSVSKYDFTDYTKFSKTIIIPDGWGNSTGANIPWYWTFNISGVTYENTTSQNLIVYEVAIDDCSSYGTEILNYTLYDEETKSQTLPTPLANQSIEVDVLLTSYQNSSLVWNYSTKETDVNSMDICVPDGLLNVTDYKLGVVTRYKADDHVVEFNYIDDFNLSLTNIPQIKNLYDLYTGTDRTEYSTSFLVNYQDEYYLPVEDAVIDLLRYYVDEGEYISVENAKTDVDGNTRLHLVTEDVRYKAIVRVSGEIVYTSPTFLALCQSSPCQINFQKQNDVTPTNLTTIDNLNYQVTLDADTRVVEMTYSTNDGSSVAVEMNVTKWDAYSNETICTDSATSSGGTLSCSVPLTATNTTYLVSIGKNSQALPTYTFDLKPSAYDTFGYTGVILTGLLFLTLVLMAVSSGPIAVVVFGLLGIIFAGILNIFEGGSIIGVGASLMWLIVAGVIIIIKASNRRSGG